MTTNGSQPKNDAATDAPRRPYRTPRLRHLGCVRELTLGKSTNTGADVFSEGFNMFMANKM